MEILKLIETLTDRDEWPWVRSPDQLEALDKLSQEALARSTIDGAVASVLITHQILDELIKQLIAQCRFAVHLALAGDELEVVFGTDDSNEDLDRQMTGKLIEKLRSSIEFEEKHAFLELCRDIAEIRNRFAHQLSSQSNLAGLLDTASKYREKYETAFALYESASEVFELLFKEHRKNDSWDFVLAELLDSDLEPERREAVEKVISMRRAAGFGTDC